MLRCDDLAIILENDKFILHIAQHSPFFKKIKIYFKFLVLILVLKSWS